MKKLLVSFMIVALSFAFAHDEMPIKPNCKYDGMEAIIFSHDGQLYIYIDNHLYFCDDLLHSEKCPCLDEEDNIKSYVNPLYTR